MNALETVKAMISSSPEVPDEVLGVYLNMAQEEILYWTFGRDTELTEVQSWLVPIQTMAVVIGINGNGTEGDTEDNVDSVSHKFKYAEMLEYIHENAPAYVKVNV